ncbi:hypothetical protein Syun_025505 [Stephania yunnanensis]|uniref:Flotillin-like n=1 Tax=Stephania yunnanensis TaxID=152371 RepID=A0AAP0HW92_9MAGN
MAEIEANKVVEIRAVELQRGFEKMSDITQTEKIRAVFFGKAGVEYEAKVQQANWELYEKQKAAVAVLYKKEKETEVERIYALKSLFVKQQLTDAELYT